MVADYVTGEKWKNKSPFRLVLNKQASAEIIGQGKHYTGRGGRTYYATDPDLAKSMGVQVATLEREHATHCQATMQTISENKHVP